MGTLVNQLLTIPQTLTLKVVSVSSKQALIFFTFNQTVV